MPPHEILWKNVNKQTCHITHKKITISWTDPLPRIFGKDPKPSLWIVNSCISTVLNGDFCWWINVREINQVEISKEGNDTATNFQIDRNVSLSHHRPSTPFFVCYMKCFKNTFWFIECVWKRFPFSVVGVFKAETKKFYISQ